MHSRSLESFNIIPPIQHAASTKAPTIAVLRPPDKQGMSIVTAWSPHPGAGGSSQGMKRQFHQPRAANDAAASAFEKVLAMTSQYLSSTCEVKQSQSKIGALANPLLQRAKRNCASTNSEHFFSPPIKWVLRNMIDGNSLALEVSLAWFRSWQHNPSWNPFWKTYVYVTGSGGAEVCQSRSSTRMFEVVCWQPALGPLQAWPLQGDTLIIIIVPFTPPDPKNGDHTSYPIRLYVPPHRDLYGNKFSNESFCLLIDFSWPPQFQKPQGRSALATKGYPPPWHRVWVRPGLHSGEATQIFLVRLFVFLLACLFFRWRVPLRTIALVPWRNQRKKTVHMMFFGALTVGMKVLWRTANAKSWAGVIEDRNKHQIQNICLFDTLWFCFVSYNPVGTYPSAVTQCWWFRATPHTLQATQLLQGPGLCRREPAFFFSLPFFRSKGEKCNFSRHFERLVPLEWIWWIWMP